MGKYNKNYNNSNDEFARDMEAPVESEPVAEVQAPVEEPTPVTEGPKPDPIAKPEPKKEEVKVEPKKKSNTPGIVASKGPARL